MLDDSSANSWTEIATSAAGGVFVATGDECVIDDPGGGLREVKLTGALPVASAASRLLRLRVDMTE